MGPRHRAEGGDLEKSTRVQRRSFADRLPHGVRNHLVAILGEFVGTFLFLFFAFAGTQTANTPASTSGSDSTNLPTGPNPLLILFISLSFGVSLAATVWVFFRISGGMFNPAVTLGLCLVGAVPVIRGILVVPAQLAGAIASAAVVRFIFPGPLAVTTSLNGGTSTVQGLFIEMFLTTQLVFTILMLAVEKHRATFLAPLGIGLSLFVAELAGVFYTGGSLNPARSFGPCVANLDFPPIHWIYWVGPFLGAMLAAAFYHILKFLKYETSNPGQDDDELLTRLLREREDMDTTPKLPLNENFGRPLSMPETLFERQSAHYPPTAQKPSPPRDQNPAQYQNDASYANRAHEPNPVLDRNPANYPNRSQEPTSARYSSEAQDQTPTRYTIQAREPNRSQHHTQARGAEPVQDPNAGYYQNAVQYQAPAQVPTPTHYATTVQPTQQRV